MMKNIRLFDIFGGITLAALGDAEYIDSALNRMQSALLDGADINMNIHYSCFYLVKRLLNDIDQFTSQHYINLIKITQFMIDKGLDLNKAACLDAVIPAFNKQPRAIEPLMQLLFQQGAYQAKSYAAVSCSYQENLLSKIKLVKDIQTLVIDELKAEFNRLNLKYKGYSTRKELIYKAYTNLERALKHFREGQMSEPLLLLLATEICNQLPDEQLDKYKNLKGRRYCMNILTVIFTGIVPGVVKYALQGSFFWSMTGKTVEVVRKARVQMENINKQGDISKKARTHYCWENIGSPRSP